MSSQPAIYYQENGDKFDPLEIMEKYGNKRKDEIPLEIRGAVELIHSNFWKKGIKLDKNISNKSSSISPENTKKTRAEIFEYVNKIKSILRERLENKPTSQKPAEEMAKIVLNTLSSNEKNKAYFLGIAKLIGMDKIVFPLNKELIFQYEDSQTEKQKSFKISLGKVILAQETRISLISADGRSEYYLNLEEFAQFIKPDNSRKERFLEHLKRNQTKKALWFKGDFS